MADDPVANEGIAPKLGMPEPTSAWAGLCENLREVVFPAKLPPLQLTSKSIAVPDPMAMQRSPAAMAVSAAINIAVLAALLLAFRVHVIPQAPPKYIPLITFDLKADEPRPVAKGDASHGGGSGGSHQLLAPTKGRPPKSEKQPLTPPQVATVQRPPLEVEPAVRVEQIKLPDDQTLPTLGMTTLPKVTFSDGPGKGGGIGTNDGGGVGPGHGIGDGPGFDEGNGGDRYKLGKGMSAPTLLRKVDAEFSDEARRRKYEGVVLVSLIVDANGNPQHVRVSRSLGMGLDEKALEAVRQYKFKPAFDKVSGKNVPVQMSVEISFHLY
jgi:protein TonB